MRVRNGGIVTGEFVALVRGINLGKAKRVAMADLRGLLRRLGYGEARTLLNSGNAIFTADGREPGAIARAIEAGLVERLGVSARVHVLTATAFSDVVEENRLAAVATNPSRLLVAFCDDARRLGEVAPLTRQDWSPEALAVGRRAAYVWCPPGVLASRLLVAVGGVLGDATTTRNWATVTRIHAALQSGRDAGGPARRPRG